MLKSTFLILLTLLLSISFNNVHSQTATTSDSVDAAGTGDSNEVTADSQDDADDDTDSIDSTGDSDDDSTDTDTDSDDDDSENSTDDSNDSDTDSEDDDSGDSDTDSNASGDESSDSTSFDSDDAEEVDAFCASLAVDNCHQYTDDDGYHLCAVNVNSNNCYGIVASEGIYGNGNFDRGYTAASQTADSATQQLNTIVGVLGGIVGLLAIAGAFGGYYFYTKSKAVAQEASREEVMSMELDDEMTTGHGQAGSSLMA